MIRKAIYFNLLFASIFLASNAFAVDNFNPATVDIEASFNLLKDQGLIPWIAMPGATHGEYYFEAPQINYFDSHGELKYQGSALDMMKWAVANFPNWPISAKVHVRNFAKMVKLFNIQTPISHRAHLVIFVSRPCPPCIAQVAKVQQEVLPRLDENIETTVIQIGVSSKESEHERFIRRR